jgi:hypothetical protein
MRGFVFINFLVVIFAVMFLTCAVFADDNDRYFRWKAGYELVCDGDEPMLLNLKTGRMKKIHNVVYRALAQEICELKAFNEACNSAKAICDGICTDTNTDSNNCGECGNICSSGEQCVAGVCESVDLCAGVVCDDGNECTDDSCDPFTGGCTHTVNPGRPCDDGDPCTENDECQVDGNCSGMLKNCDDGNECTDDSCDPFTGGCTSTVNPGRPCDDGDSCTINDYCDADGNCSGMLNNCDDGNDCTSDYCVNGLCLHSPACTTGQECKEDEDCISEHCFLGICL